MRDGGNGSAERGEGWSQRKVRDGAWRKVRDARRGSAEGGDIEGEGVRREVRWRERECREK